MNRFEWCVNRIIYLIEKETLTNDPHDPGGLTKFGISQRRYPDVDIANLTRAGAIELYRRDYWDLASCAKLPEPLDFYVFDSAINQGPGYAVRELQEAVGTTRDGVLGPVTLRAIARMTTLEAAALFMVGRAFDYAALTNYSRYGKGWLKRLFIVAATT